MISMPTVMIQKAVSHVNVKMDSMVMDLSVLIETNVKLIMNAQYLLIVITFLAVTIVNVKLDLPVSKITADTFRYRSHDIKSS